MGFLPLDLISTAGSMWKGLADTVFNIKKLDVDRDNYDLNKQNLEWMKEMQKEQWAREDTSYQRTKQDMLQSGLNPLSMQGTNGAGEVVSLPQLESPQSVPQVSNPMQGLGDLANTIEQRINGKLQRDQLQQLTNKQKIDNAITLYRYGGSFDENGNIVFDKNNPNFKKDKLDYDSADLDYQDKKREYDNKVDKGYYDTDEDWERAITKITDILTGDSPVSKSLDKLKEEFPWLSDLIEALKSFNQPKEDKKKPKNGWSLF